ncbi:MAG: alcohol dehydrogenase catalytic domain-containing protein [Candidatus Gastranaerophilales bacterium]|nr:alcohol dehydrogenase catalytic domain-containing protein [Candidatus Gastranaerophilales bacterium]
MRAIEFDEKIILNKNYKEPELKQGESIIRVLLGGICNTDIEITKGYMGFKGILGHEFVGIVEKSTDENLIGKRVVGEINCACGDCEYCRLNIPTQCPNRSTLGILNKEGCFADYVSMPNSNILIVPNNVSNEEAVFTEPLAAAIQIIEQIHIKPSDKILILGDGKLGLLTALVLNTTLANILLAGRHQNKLDIAKNQGINTILSSELSKERIFDIVIDATGSIDGFEMAQILVKPRGTIVLKSTVAGGKKLNLAPIVIDEITIIGSRCGRFEPALRLLSKNVINLNYLVSKIYPVEHAIEAFYKSKQKGVLKVLIDFTTT